MGAGILPVTLIKGSIFFLLGKEINNDYWCDFGGTALTNELTFDTAIREGYEELDGFLGNKNDLRNLVKTNLITICNRDRYTTYIFYVNNNVLSNLPYYFNNHRKFVKNEIERDIINKEGLFEKSEIRLFSKKDLITNYNDIRPFYREIVKDILEI